MITYFGQDESGFYVMRDDSCMRISEELWMAYVNTESSLTTPVLGHLRDEVALIFSSQ